MRAAILLGLALASGCSDDACGIGAAPATGLVATAGTATLTFGAVSGGANNDCPATDAPSGVTALTIQTPLGDPKVFTLCIGRPDKLGGGLPLSVDDTTHEDVLVVDTLNAAGGCTFKLDRTVPATGTAKADGLCDAGTNAAGFALTLDGAVTLTRTCGTTVDSVAATLSGRVAVTPM